MVASMRGAQKMPALRAGLNSLQLFISSRSGGAATRAFAAGAFTFFLAGFTTAAFALLLFISAAGSLTTAAFAFLLTISAAGPFTTAAFAFLLTISATRPFTTATFGLALLGLVTTTRSLAFTEHIACAQGVDCKRVVDGIGCCHSTQGKGTCQGSTDCKSNRFYAFSIRHHFLLLEVSRPTRAS